MATIDHSTVRWNMLGMAQAHHPDDYMAKADEWADWIKGDLDRYNAFLTAARDPKHAKNPLKQAAAIEKWAKRAAPKPEHESVAAVKGQEPPVRPMAKRGPGRPPKARK